MLFCGRHDTQHNDICDTQHNDTQHNDIQHNEIQHNDIQHNDTHHKGFNVMLSISDKLHDIQNYNTLPL